MSRPDYPASAAEIQQVLAECRKQVEAVPAPDVSAAVRHRIERSALPSPAVDTQSAGGTSTWTDEPAATSDHFDLPIAMPGPTHWRREALKFAAGLFAFVALAAVLVLVFRPSSNDAGSDDASVPTTPAVIPQSPFPLLAIMTPPDDRHIREIYPVDPLTLEPLPNYEPIEFDVGECCRTIERTVSPDGRTAVLVSHILSGTQQRGQTVLQLIDLAAWEATVIDEWEFLFASGNLARPRFSSDGRTLYWFEREPLVVGESDLMSYDLDTATQTTLATLPADFEILDFAPISKGSRIAILGVPIQRGLALDDGGSVSGDYATGNAQVLLVDLDDGSITETIALDGVVAGALALNDAEGDSFPVHLTTPGVAWDVDRDRLYIAHPTEARMTVVDLDAGEVQQQVDLEGGTSVLDRLAGWLFPSAQAVARSFSHGYAALVDGGQRLAVAMNSERMTLDRQEVEEERRSPVRLIDVDSEDVIWEVDLGGVQGLAPARNGTQLLVHTFPRLTPLGLTGDEADHHLTLLDVTTGEIVKQLDLPGRPGKIRDSMIVAGDYVYIETSGEVVVVDPASLTAVGGWQWKQAGPNLYALLPLP